jgi:hypothetical protein
MLALAWDSVGVYVDWLRGYRPNPKSLYLLQGGVCNSCHLPSSADAAIT